MFDLRNDIEKAIKKYPSLELVVSDETPYIRGVFIAHNKANNIEIERYDVVIGFKKNYPYSFPLVIETSKKIPRELDRHVKSDATLCFGNWQDEIRICKNGITLTWFLDEILNTHLCREYIKEKTTEYPTGERSHGMEGIWEGYYEILNTTDKTVVLSELDLVLNHARIGRNAPCYCNNGKKYKTCHEKIEKQVTEIGKSMAVVIFGLLKKDYEENK